MFKYSQNKDLKIRFTANCFYLPWLNNQITFIHHYQETVFITINICNGSIQSNTNLIITCPNLTHWKDLSRKGKQHQLSSYNVTMFLKNLEEWKSKKLTGKFPRGGKSESYQEEVSQKKKVKQND